MDGKIPAGNINIISYDKVNHVVSLEKEMRDKVTSPAVAQTVLICYHFVYEKRIEVICTDCLCRFCRSMDALFLGVRQQYRRARALVASVSRGGR